MPNRNGNANSYRYGFQGQEKDDEVKGSGNSLDFGGRSIYDGRLGRFISVDPRWRDFSFMSPYVYAANNPILFIDENGEGPIIPESFWKGKSWGYGFMAGFLNEGTSQGVEATELVMYGLFGVLAEVEGGTFENYAQYGPFGWMAYDVMKSKLEIVSFLQVVFKNEEVRKKVVSEVGSLLKEWGEDAAFENGGAEAGYAHGQAFFIALEAVVGSKGVQNFIKTGKLNLNIVKKNLLKRAFICGCFSKGTQVYTEEGYKNIEDVKKGDLVWAYDEKSKEFGLKEVVETISKVRNHVYRIHFAEETIDATNDHPFFIGGMWVNVIDLREGDFLTLYDGSQLKINKIEYIKEETRVYNFVVKDFHSYYVSKQKVLVHNGRPCKVKFQTKGGIFGGDWVSKKIHADVVTGKGKDLGEVSFRLSADGESIVAKEVFNNKNSDLVVELGTEFISKPENRKKLLVLAKDALSGRNTSSADKVELKQMIKILEKEQ